MIKVYVIHVKSHTVREKLITKQLEPLGLDYTFLTEGDCDELTEEIISKYFISNSKHWTTPNGPLPRISCAYKHLMACKHIIDENLEGALILEDDIILHKNFMRYFEKSISEWKGQHYEEPFLANYEDSSLMLIPRSKRKKNQMLYKANRDRFGGCYFVSKKGAEAIYDYVAKNKTDLPNDLLHSKLTKEGIINYYWTHPCIATQGSFTGKNSSTLSNKKDYLISLRWLSKNSYKKILYFFR